MPKRRQWWQAQLPSTSPCCLPASMPTRTVSMEQHDFLARAGHHAANLHLVVQAVAWRAGRGMGQLAPGSGRQPAWRHDGPSAKAAAQATISQVQTASKNCCSSGEGKTHPSRQGFAVFCPGARL